jgi:hypothetical protein
MDSPTLWQQTKSPLSHLASAGRILVIEFYPISGHPRQHVVHMMVMVEMAKKSHPQEHT